jgi:CBS domain-containing membrane protein
MTRAVRPMPARKTEKKRVPARDPGEKERSDSMTPSTVSSARRGPGSGATGAGRQKPATRERFVRDLMTEKVHTLTPKDDLASLYDLMDSLRVRHVPIVDSEGEIVGLVTDRDLSRSALGAVADLPLSVERDILRRRRVRDIMATEPDVIEADARLKEAAGMLLENKVGCLPVVEGLRLVGILTEADFVRDFLERG